MTGLSGTKTAGASMAAMLISVMFLSPYRSLGQILSATQPQNSSPPNQLAAPANAVPGDPQRDLEVLRRLEEEYLRAEIEDDSTIAGTILADDYVGIRADGSTTGKADVLANLDRHERRRQPYLITATNMREHLFGDSACLTYTKVYTRPGSHNAYSENVLHLLIRRNGLWRLQLSSPLPTPRP